MTTAPVPGGLSVIVPTKGRVALVARALDSLHVAARHAGSGMEWEVILVDDSVEPAAEQLRSLCRGRNRARYIRGPANVGAKRNRGAEQAQFDRLIFLDSDCSVDKGFLAGHRDAAALRTGPSGRPVGAVAGPVVMADDAHSWRTRLADYSPLFNAPFDWPARYSEVYWACTANLAVPRNVFESIGGFDEQPFTVVGGEDVDFCLRLQDAKYAICCQPTAVAVHTRTLCTSFREMAAKMLLYGRSSVYNSTRHPHHSEFHPNPSVLLPAAVLAAPWRKARRAVGAAALGWFTLHTAAHIRRTGGSPLAVGATALDWIFDLGLATEAIRRTSPALALRRFRYFDNSRYISRDEVDHEV
ncbi:glycosyltransferase [Streptomyces sp. NBS 14/10]|uniref:glycosyltransferase family 2 protein n=1 Tax=Streptomyces sp. NBS 14/10 TaxID=1945643 RepID=UPI000B7FF3AA|nr:glycosyltransferase [Streptomyces sp. NBS 14/10]KAK1184382.1 glycosyltransferase [Streptomyces sp. NBS 14/10]